MHVRRNTVLEQLLTAQGYTSGSLTAEVNRTGEQIFGRPGRVTVRTVQRWLSGTVRYPAARHLIPLTHVFALSPAELGFAPGGRRVPAVRPRRPLDPQEPRPPVPCG
ncbi:hypothetical protein [Streptomyces sp. NPDC005953]|uniref:hypothetical protein n=1 Tax=Streptomyces sp. NPDC005953 TaxID=3156719 RepID=UPI0033E7A85C